MWKPFCLLSLLSNEIESIKIAEKRSSFDIYLAASILIPGFGNLKAF